MQKGDQNKMMTGAANKSEEQPLQDYFIPEAGRTVQARSIEEAIAIIDKERDN